MLCFLLEVTFSTVKYIFCSERILVKIVWLPGLKRIWKWTFVVRWVTFANSSWLRYRKRLAETKNLSSLIQIILTVLVPWQGCTISTQIEVLGKLQNSGYSTLIDLMTLQKQARASVRENMHITMHITEYIMEYIIIEEYGGIFFQETKKSY